MHENRSKNREKNAETANMIKSYRRTKSFARCKRNDVSEQLASSIHYLFYSLNTSGSAAAMRNGEKKATKNTAKVKSSR